ncbi:hypothetical protein An05g00210 [Aspergillus niger]|uniref:Uncharacterized protein n=2 Tax=Aspergillus niger TaxID=5061 RepID=A2QKH2_ASPNC|nr:hypothetical protein An05g00210 [Aspergillus niger]CAK44841.1 hypothetical protein An05g00210 [Aspergillus niger]
MRSINDLSVAAYYPEYGYMHQMIRVVIADRSIFGPPDNYTACYIIHSTFPRFIAKLVWKYIQARGWSSGVRGNGKTTYFVPLGWLASKAGARSGSQVAWFRVYWLGISLVSSRLVGASGQVVYASSSKGFGFDDESQSRREGQVIALTGLDSSPFVGKSGAAQNYQSLIRLLPDRSKMSGNLSLDVFRRVSGVSSSTQVVPGSEWAWRAGTAAEKQRAWLGDGR